MSTYNNALEQFIVERCGTFIASVAERYIDEHKDELKITDNTGATPPFVFVEFMDLDSCDKSYILDDTLRFNVSAHCNILMSDGKEIYDKRENIHLRIFCCATFGERLQEVLIERVEPFREARLTPIEGAVEADGNAIPAVWSAEVDEEAKAFLRRYCREALTKPMPIPIEQILIDMGLSIERRYCLSTEGNLLGGIAFADSIQHLYDDGFDHQAKAVRVKRGTVLLDNLHWIGDVHGRTRNTMAHEAYHWFRHRVYAAVRTELGNKPITAHRCPEKVNYVNREGSYPEEDRLEWQASHIAPRILMPQRTFRQKAKEYCKARNYVSGRSNINDLYEIAVLLADFFQVSKESAIIRLREIGYREASKLTIPPVPKLDLTVHLDPQPAFFEYRTNQDFRNMIESGMFRHIDGFYVINHEKYVKTLDDGRGILTEYAKQHLDECALVFRYTPLKSGESVPGYAHIFYRPTDGKRMALRCATQESKPVIELAESTLEWKERFNLTLGDHPVRKTFWEVANEYMAKKHWNAQIFEDLTGLGENLYNVGHRNPNNPVKFHTAVSICAALKLDFKVSEELLRLAGYGLSDSDEHMAYRFVLSDMRFQSIEEKNAFLESVNVTKLGARTYKKTNHPFSKN